MNSTGIYLVLLFNLLTFHGFAGNQQGKILKIKTDVYQIDYANQIINIYFNYSPDDSFDNLVAGIQVTPEKKMEIVRTICGVVDQLPDDFIGKFLGLEIFPMHILSETIAGYYSAGKIVLEISDEKLSRMYDGSIQENFLHEVAHHIYKQMEYRPETVALMDFLKDIQRQSPLGYIHRDNYMPYGYISFYSSGGSSGKYDPEEEFAELFAHLVCRNNREKMMQYLREHSGGVLDKKVNRYISYLGNIIPSLNHDFFHGIENPMLAYTEAHNEEVGILTAHEQKSYETIPQEEHDDANVSDIAMMVGQIEKEFDKDFETDEIITEDDLDIAFVYEPEIKTESSTANKKNERKKQHKAKKTKNKSRGEGWLLSAFGIAIAVAAELLL